MTEGEFQHTTALVLALAFAIGVLFGAIGQRTRFCTMGAISDMAVMGDPARMRMWLVAGGVAIVGFNALAAFGLVRAADSIYAAPRLLWLSALVGGAMFGFGMVLASGCGSKTLVRIGGGSLKSLVVFFVLAVSAYATLRGIVAVARVGSIDRVAVNLPVGQDLPSLAAHAVGGAVHHWALGLGCGVGVMLLLWSLSRAEGRTGDVLLGGLGIGAVVVGVWWVSGVLGHVPEHPLTLEDVYIGTNTQRMESLSFVAPVAYTVDWLILFSDASKVLTIGIVTTLGVIAGSAVAAVAERRFRWEGFGGTEDTANHLVGAALMGVGGVTAMGCTIGQGISGVSTLALGSFIALASIVAGAVLALRWQVWRVDRVG